MNQRIPLNDIIVDENLNVRKELDNETIECYMESFDQLPAVVVFKNDEIRGYLLADGFHRCEAAKRLEKDKIDAEVKVVDGEAIDAYNAAEEYAALANLRHGKPLTRTERRTAVERMLTLHPERSDRWIAEDMGVDHKSVRTYREELESVGEIPQLNNFVGKDGKEYPRERKQPQQDEQPPDEITQQSQETETVEVEEPEHATPIVESEPQEEMSEAEEPIDPEEQQQDKLLVCTPYHSTEAEHIDASESREAKELTPPRTVIERFSEVQRQEFQRQLVQLQHWCFALAHRENVNQSIEMCNSIEKTAGILREMLEQLQN